MSDRKRQIVEKIRKLLALSKSDNEHEAALAMVNVRKLLDEHSLTITEIDMEDEFEPSLSHYKFRTTFPGWTVRLLNVVSQNTLTKAVNNSGVIIFVGTGPDSEVANYLMQFLYKTIFGMATKHLKTDFCLGMSRRAKVECRKQYSLGVINTIEQKLHMFKRNRDESLPVDVKEKLKDKDDLKKAIVQEIMDKRIPMLRKRSIKVSERESHPSFKRGAKDGHDVAINIAVQGTAAEEDQKKLCSQ